MQKIRDYGTLVTAHSEGLNYGVIYGKQLARKLQLFHLVRRKRRKLEGELVSVMSITEPLRFFKVDKGGFVTVQKSIGGVRSSCVI